MPGSHPPPIILERPDCWHVYCGAVHVGTISKCVGNPGAAEAWQWLCGFYPGSNPGDQRGGTAGTFEQARAEFEAAWCVYLPKRSEADFKAQWTAGKDRRFDRGERMPPDWRAGELRRPPG